MKKFLRGIGAVAALTVASGASAQLPDFGVYPGDHTGTTIDGDAYDIDAILDSGTPVLIDAFADWCGPCWTYHTGGTLEDVYNTIGMGGSGDVYIIGMEADPSVPEANISDAGTGTGDWTLGGTVEYPLADDDMISGNINLAYYPTLVLVCPDRSTTEVGQVSAAEWEAAVAACPGLSTDDNDPRIIGNATPTNINVCGDGDVEAEIKVVVQNNSAGPISGDYTFEATLGGAVIATSDITLDLASYEVMEVSLGMATLAEGSNDITVEITTDNDDLTNDMIDASVNVTQAYDLGIGDIVVSATFDGYGSEVGYGIASGEPSESDPFAAYPMFSGDSYPGQIDFQAIGTWTNSDAGFDASYVSLTTGCYHLYMFDNFGDGMTEAGGALAINSPNSGETFDINIDYGSGAAFLFEITTDGTGGFTGIEEVETIEFARVYPNPAVNQTNVQFELNEAANVSIELINAMGQVVFANNLGEVNGQQTLAIDASELSEGIYLINISVDNQVITKRLSVVK